jgi:hypothetical protein
VVVQPKGGGQVKILADGVERQAEEQPQTETRGRARRGRKSEPTADTFEADPDDEIPF